MYNIEFLVFFLKVFFLCEGASQHANLRSLRDSLLELGNADAKYQETIDKYNTIKAQNYLNYNEVYIVIPADEYYEKHEKIARVNHDIEHTKNEKKAAIVQWEHEARMKEIIDFMKNHMMTTKYLHEEVRRIKRTREVKDRLRDMVTYLENPKRLYIKQRFLDLFNFIQKHYSVVPPNIWDQKVNDMVINVIKDPFNDGVIN